VQVLHVAGNGLLSSAITSVTGGADQAIWLVSTLAISAAALGVPVSQAADYWGRKWFVVGFTACGAVGCLIASRAQSFAVVLAGQSIACLSLGAQPLVHAIASEIIPRKYRPFAQTAVNLASGTGGAVGVTMGGALVRSSPQGFRVYFYITAGLYAIMGLIVAWIYRPPPRALQLELSTREKLGRLDWIGCALSVPGLILFSYALTSSTGVYPWSSPIIISTLVVGSVMLIMFGLHEWRFTRTGMLHHGLFSRGRNFAICLVLIFTEGLAFFAANSFFAFENVAIYGRSFFRAGLAFTIVFWTANVATVITGLYISRTKRLRLPLIFATTCVAVFFACMASLKLGSEWNPLGYAVLLGAGLGSALNTVIVTAQLSTPPELIAVASGLMIAFRSIGGTVGLSVFQAIFGSTFGKDLAPDVLTRVIPLGFDPIYTGMLLAGLTTQNTTLVDDIPGVTPLIVAAAATGVKTAYVTTFRNVWIAATCFACVALFRKWIPVDQQPSTVLTYDS
jgi:MFS family permease